MKSSGDKEVAYELRCAVVTCRIIFKYTFEKIEKKTGMKKDTARNFTIERASYEDFNEVLACVGDLDRLGRIPDTQPRNICLSSRAMSILVGSVSLFRGENVTLSRSWGRRCALGKLFGHPGVLLLVADQESITAPLTNKFYCCRHCSCFVEF